MTTAVIANCVRPASQPVRVTPSGSVAGEIPFTVQRVTNRGDGYLLVQTDSCTPIPFVWRLPAQGHRWIREYDLIVVVAAIDSGSNTPADRDGTVTIGDKEYAVCVAHRAEPRGHAATQRFMREERAGR